MSEQGTCANSLYLLPFCCAPKAHLKTYRLKYDNNNKRQNVKQYSFVFLCPLVCIYPKGERQSWGREREPSDLLIIFTIFFSQTTMLSYIWFAYLCHLHKEYICIYFNFRAACLSMIILFDHAFPLYGLWIHDVGLCSDSYQCSSMDFI